MSAFRMPVVRQRTDEILAGLDSHLGVEAQRRVLWAAVALGVALRLVAAFGYAHTSFDIKSFAVVGDALVRDPLHVYAIVDPIHWPYPPTFFPWVLVARGLHDLGLPFSAALKLPSVAADAALALIVHAEMLRSGQRPALALGGGLAVALGPTFILNSGYHGQIDSVAILPAVLGLIAWRRMPQSRRAIVAGLLIGLAASVKAPAGLVLLALLPLCATWREAVKLAGGAAIVPLVVAAPFLATTPGAVIDAVTTRDVPGVGGLHLFTVLTLDSHRLTRMVEDHGVVLLGVVIAATLLLLWKRRPIQPYVAGTLLWLGFYAVAPSFFFGYLIWGIPFFLLAGYVWSTVGLMAIVLIPTVLFETGRGGAHLELFKWLMTFAWFALIAAFVVLWVDVQRRAGRAAPGRYSG